MSSSTFRFKQFEIQQDKCAMKVGTDGVLIGTWCNVNDKKQILDVGAGTALVSLMAAQRSENADIDAIEIEEEACGQARENVRRSPFSDRVNIICADFRTFDTPKRYDLIVSNPPFFTESTTSGIRQRDNARHTDSLPFSILMSKSKELLAEKGELDIIVPYAESDNIIATAALNGMYLIRRTDIRTKATKQPKRTLMSFGTTIVPTLYEQLSIMDDNGYTGEYIRLTSPFYL